MIKLNVNVSGGYNDETLEFEISNELAELLRQWSYRDSWNELSEEKKTCNEFDLDIYCEELEDLEKNNEGVSERVIHELNVIEGQADDKGAELAVASFLESDPPTEFFLDERMPKDIEAGLFTPSVCFEQFFEQFLKDNDYWDPSDEDYDEESAQEEARDEYNEIIFDEYQDWVETLPTYERADRYGLSFDAPIPEHDYTFVRVNKTAE